MDTIGGLLMGYEVVAVVVMAVFAVAVVAMAWRVRAEMRAAVEIRMAAESVRAEAERKAHLAACDIAVNMAIREQVRRLESNLLRPRLAKDLVTGMWRALLADEELAPTEVIARRVREGCPVCGGLSREGFGYDKRHGARCDEVQF